MKKTIKKLVSFILVFAMIMAMAVPVFAESTIYESFPQKKYVTTLPPSTKGSLWLAVLSGKASSLKNSDSSVGKLTQRKQSNGSYVIELNYKKAGKTTISFKYKGKTYKSSITLLKYENPVKSITVGNKKISGSEFNKKAYYSFKMSDFSSKNVKVKVNLKSGWILAGNAPEFAGTGYTGIQVKEKHYKNGASIPLKKENGEQFMFISISMKNPKNGKTARVDIDFW